MSLWGFLKYIISLKLEKFFQSCLRLTWLQTKAVMAFQINQQKCGQGENCSGEGQLPDRLQWGLPSKTVLELLGFTPRSPVNFLEDYGKCSGWIFQWFYFS